VVFVRRILHPMITLDTDILEGYVSECICHVKIDKTVIPWNVIDMVV